MSSFCSFSQGSNSRVCPKSVSEGFAGDFLSSSRVDDFGLRATTSIKAHVLTILEASVGPIHKLPEILQDIDLRLWMRATVVNSSGEERDEMR